MKNPTIFFFLFLVLSSCKSNTLVTVFTQEGKIEIELYSKKAPKTVANFLQYVDDKVYDKTSFYRTVSPNNQPNSTVKIEVIQGGLGFNVSGKERSPIHHENTKTTGILHLDGTISMARADTGTVTSEFFICIGDQPELDYGGIRNPDLQGFAAFGKVKKGIEVVKKIQNKPNTEQMINSAVVIDSIRIIK